MALSKCDSFKMNNGLSIPIIGLGSYKVKDQRIKDIVKGAIEIGYRMIDTAYLYENEKEIGEAIQELIKSGKIKREDLFVVSKVWNTFHSRAKVMEAVKISLKNMSLDYIDLYLIHWPHGFDESSGIWPKNDKGKIKYSKVDYVETWQGMEDIHLAGLVKSIGVSNFNRQQLGRVLNMCKVKPVINQVESHPYLTQDKLLDFCRKHEILLEAFCPLARGLLAKDETLLKIASAHKKTFSQIALRFQAQRGIISIPRSSQMKRIVENLDLFDFELTENEMQEIGKLNKNERCVWVKEYNDHPHYPFKEVLIHP